MMQQLVIASQNLKANYDKRRLSPASHYHAAAVKRGDLLVLYRKGAICHVQEQTDGGDLLVEIRGTRGNPNVPYALQSRGLGGGIFFVPVSSLCEYGGE